MSTPKNIAIKKHHSCLARYGKTASSVLKGAEAKPLTDEELESVIRELYFENVERKVKQNGKVKFEGKWYHVGRKKSG
jgi:hypothetical protein